MKKIRVEIEKAKSNKEKSLHLSGLNLDQIPDELFDLDYLEELNLSNNNLQDIPPDLLILKNLRSLNLHSNRLEKIPGCIYNFTDLDTLILTANPIKYIDPSIGQLRNLRRLAAAQTEIETVPPEIGELRYLHTLNLGSPLGNGNISSLPGEFGKLTNLLVLYLAGNNLKILPKEFGQLENLFILDLGGNSIECFPQFITLLSKLEVLDLGGNVLYGYNMIESIPDEIGMLRELRNLNLSYNTLRLLPNELYDLQNLETLNLKSNKISSLSNKILRLTKLRHICVDQNELERLPSKIGQLGSLRFLEARSNKLTFLPNSLKDMNNLRQLSLGANNIEIPPEIIAKIDEPQEIINFYVQTHQGKFSTLGEAKLMLIGEGGVGKTSIARKLIGDDFSDDEKKTEGIAIYKWNVADDEPQNEGVPPININLWDFGGQEIMHATHQFFFSKRSLYLLVVDARLTQEVNRLEYWLRIIQSFGGESPVLVVGNKIDQQPLDIDRTGLQKKYPNIVDFIETSAATGVGLKDLRAAITEHINNLQHVHDLLPKTWFAVKTKLERLGRQSSFITYDKYVELCNKNKVSDETSQRTLIGFLHDLGVVLHFQDDPRLEALGILNPQWVTNGVYKILNSHTLFQNKGVLTVSMLDEILNLPEYPRGKRLFIVDMMKKFELCYDIEPDKTFLVPDLLPKDEPAELKFNGVPAFEYTYPVLPSSAITRFIVRMNQKIDDGLVWRTGVVLKIGENKALVKADIEDRKITIAIDGVEHTRRDALSAIRYQLDEIHHSIRGLNPEKYVPVPGVMKAKPLKYEYLLKLERDGEDTLKVEDGDGLKKINIIQMLNGVESEYQRKQYGNVINIGGNVDGSTIIVGNDNQVNK